MTRVYLHIGAPKTGTTYLQAVLFRNRARLRRAGVLYPGGTSDAHFRATLDLRGMAFRGYADPATEGAWGHLVGSVRGWRGQAAVLSHELLGGSTPDVVDTLLADLAPAEVHVVHTARDLGRQVPAVWQEMVKNQRTLPYGSFLDQVTGAREGRGAGVFWRQQDVPEVLARWHERVPAERVHLVTVPPPGSPPGRLWERFCAALGLDPWAYDTVAPRANTSLGLAEAEVLRRVNVALGDRLAWPDYARLVKGGLAGRLVAQRPGGDRARVPDDLRAWFDQAADDQIRELAGRGYDVIGDLADLRPHYGDAVAANEPLRDAVVDTAASALADLLVDQARTQSRPWTWTRPWTRPWRRHLTAIRGKWRGDPRQVAG